MRRPGWIDELRLDAVDLLRDARDLVRRHPWRFSAAVLAAVAAVALLVPRDAALDRRWTASPDPDLEAAALVIRRWGDFRDSVFFFTVLLSLGWILRRRDLRRAAAAGFLAACLAGLSVNVLRVTTGRPRPKADLPDRLHGPSLRWKYQSFPSGHSATSIGCGAALAIAMPAVGILPLASAGAVVWSSVYSRNHYASDVAAGAAFGLLVAVPIGLAARRRRVRA
jgi:membrane-associated phospholipid phosphatase